ncbi:MAG: hypothetical protein RLZ98_3763 [Pseudomonadota bacterium]|jgi:hypothetical protein
MRTQRPEPRRLAQFPPTGYKLLVKFFSQEAVEEMARMAATEVYEPKPHLPLDEILEADGVVRAMPDIATRSQEDIFRICALGLDWDIGVMRHEPVDPSARRRGADGRLTGFLLLHGGSGDFRSLAPLARMLSAKFGYTALAMTFPGRHNLDDPSRDWPGDTINADGTVRTPIWKQGERITPDQYEVVTDETMRDRYGRRTLARARPGTLFYERMAAWPVAFEEAMKEACRRHFPDPDWSILTNGHSTGGAFSAYITQRVPNIVGQAEIETAPIGYINEKKHDWSGALGKIGDYDRVKKEPDPRKDPFNELSIRTWRDLARYAGPEALGEQGGAALMKLPRLMEDVLDHWAGDRTRPNFKAEYIVTHNVRPSLEAAARTAAGRLCLAPAETDALVARYLGYCHYDESPGAKPVPPILYVNSKHSRDNSLEAFEGIVLPMLAELRPAPRARVVMLDAGTHIYYEGNDRLPLGLAPIAAKIFHDAIQNGYYVTD